MVFRRVFGKSPRVKLLNFFLFNKGDFSLTEISQKARISWTTLNRIFPEFLELGVVKQTREISRAKMYSLDEDHPISEHLIDAKKGFSEHFAAEERVKEHRVRKMGFL